MSQQRRALAWDHGVVAVQSLGAMLGPTLFLLPGGRQVSPLQVAPWGSDPAREGLPGVLRELRGDWPCVPFGFDGPRNLTPGWDAKAESFAGAGLAHGICSNTDWSVIDHSDTAILLECVYPADHPVRVVRRRIVPDPTAPAIDLSLEIVTRRNCRLPIGLHPTFRLPPRPGAVGLELGPYRSLHSFPGDLEPGRALFAADTWFDTLVEAPLREGGQVDASALPLDRDFEELVQVAGASGDVSLHYRDEGYRARLTWNAAHFPSALIWMSNRGRTHWPWAGRHLAVAIEPVASAFDLGPAICNGPNPLSTSGIATNIAFVADAPFVTEYRIAVEPA